MIKMPTGYTAELDDSPELTTADWIKKHLVRNFGVCVNLRDHGTMSEEEILAFLEEQVDKSSNLYLKEYNKALEELNKISEMSFDEKKKLYDVEVARIQNYNEKSINEAHQTKLRHQKVIEELQKVKNNAHYDVLENIAQFGLDQLELVKSETQPYLQDIPSYKTHIDSKVKKLRRDVIYYSEKYTKCRERERERLEAYKQIVKRVNDILTQR